MNATTILENENLQLVGEQEILVLCRGKELQSKIDKSSHNIFLRCNGNSLLNYFALTLHRYDLRLDSRENKTIHCNGDEVTIDKNTKTKITISCLDKTKKNNSYTPTPPNIPNPSQVPGELGIGLPVGPFHYPPENFSSSSPIKYTSSFVSFEKMDVASATEILENAKANNMQIMVSIAGGGGAYRDTDKSFNFTTFKKIIDRLSTLDLEKYYEQGVILGNIILDEPQDPSNWGGVTLSAKEIKEVSQYVKNVWPNVPVGAYSPPTWLKSQGITGNDLDFNAFNFKPEKLCPLGTHNSCYGSTKEEWLTNYIAASKDAGFGVWLSLNVLKKGAPLSPALLKEYGEYFATNDDNYACGLTFWSWEGLGTNGGRDIDRDQDGILYFTETDNPGITAAMTDIVNTAKTHLSNVPCKLH